MHDHQAIASLLADWAWANDTGDLELLGQTLTDDARFEIWIAGVLAVEAIQTREAIVAFVGSAIAGQTGQRRHLASNVRVLERADDGSDFRAYVAISHTPAGGAAALVATGVYLGRAVRDDGGAWRLESFTIRLDSAF